MKYVYSTMTDDVYYGLYSPSSKNHSAKLIKTVFIKGGANRINKRTLLTESGVMTEIKDEDAELLEKDGSFQKHRENGFVTIETKKASPNSVSKNLTKKDRSAQKTDADFKEEIKNKGEKHLKAVD